MRTYSVGYFVGSLAKESINRKLSKALVRLAPADLELREISYAELPLYSWDYDSDYPPVARAFKECDRGGRRGALHHSRVQPLDPRRPEERDRLGEPPPTARTSSPTSPRRSSAPRSGRSGPPSASSTCAAS